MLKLKRSKDNKRWVGPLAIELPKIFKWVAETNDDEVSEYMNRTVENVNSFKKIYKYTKIRLNPLVEWVTKGLEPIQGKTFLGCYNVNSKHDDLVVGTILFP